MIVTFENRDNSGNSDTLLAPCLMALRAVDKSRRDFAFMFADASGSERHHTPAEYTAAPMTVNRNDVTGFIIQKKITGVEYDLDLIELSALANVAVERNLLIAFEDHIRYAQRAPADNELRI